MFIDFKQYIDIILSVMAINVLLKFNDQEMIVPRDDAMNSINNS